MLHSLISTVYDHCTQYGHSGTNTLQRTCSVRDCIQKPAFKHLFKTRGTISSVFIQVVPVQTRHKEMKIWSGWQFPKRFRCPQCSINILLLYCGSHGVPLVYIGKWQHPCWLLIMTRKNCSCEHRYHTSTDSDSECGNDVASELRWSSWGQKYHVHYGNLILRVLYWIVDYFIWCVSCTAVVWTCFVMCTCIYCVLYCFIYVYLFWFVYLYYCKDFCHWVKTQLQQQQRRWWW